MPSYAEMFFDRARASFERKQDLFKTILDSILREEIKTPAQKQAELELLAREETRLRSMEEDLRKIQLEGLKQDGVLLKTITDSSADISRANIDFNARVSSAQIKARADLAIARTEAEQAIAERAGKEQDKASQLAAEATTASALFPPAPFSGTDKAALTAAASGQLTDLWNTHFLTSYKKADTPAEKQAVVDAFKAKSEDWLKNQSGGATQVILSSAPVITGALSQTLQRVGAADAGKTAQQIIDEKYKAEKDRLQIPGGAGGPGLRGVDQEIILTRGEKLRALTGLSSADVKDVQLSFGPGTEPGKYQDYLTVAAYNRQALSTPEESDAFYKKYPTPESFKQAARQGTLNEDEKGAILEADLLDESTLKQLYSGTITQGVRDIKQRQAALDERKRMLTETQDVGQTFAGAVEKARFLYRQLFGDAPLQSGIKAAQTIANTFAGSSPEEVDAALANLPIDDRQRQILKKAATGAPISDAELRAVKFAGPSATTLDPNVISRLGENLPGFIQDGQVTVGFETTMGEGFDAFGNPIQVEKLTTPIQKDIATLSIKDLGNAFSAYGKTSGAMGQAIPTFTPEVELKIKESMALFEQLSQSQPYAVPMLNRMLGDQLDALTTGAMGRGGGAGAESVRGGFPFDIGVNLGGEASQTAGQTGREFFTGMKKGTPEAPNYGPTPDAGYFPGYVPPAAAPAAAPAAPQQAAPPATRGKAPPPIDLEILGAPDRKTATDLRINAIRKAGPDAVGAAVQEGIMKGKKAKPQEIITGLESNLAGFKKTDRDLLVELAKQSKGLKPAQIQENLSKIVNPVLDPDAFQRAAAFVGLASTDEMTSLYKAKDADRIKRELRMLS